MQSARRTDVTWIGIQDRFRTRAARSRSWARWTSSLGCMNLLDRYHESHSREEAGWRFGHYEYSGPTQVDEASAHLRLRMPQHSWRLVADEHPDPATCKLSFSRGRYLADYTIRRLEGLTE